MQADAGIPDEVLDLIRWRFAPMRERETWQPPLDRIQAFPKATPGPHGPTRSHPDRAPAWDKTRVYGKEHGIDDSTWRKCHTENYWAWFSPPWVAPWVKPSEEK